MGEYGVLDILGPVVIRPSNSYTAGTCRVVKAALTIARGKFKKAESNFHGLFAKAYRGHDTDGALLTDALGTGPGSIRPGGSLAIARQRGIGYVFREADLGDVHPSTTKVVLTYRDRITMYIIGSSIGEGDIEIIDISGITVQFTGDYPTVLLKYVDVRGIIADISSSLARYGYDIGGMKILKHGGIVTLVVELDRNIDKDLTKSLLKDKRFLFTKYTQRNQRKFMFNTSLEIIDTVKKDNGPFYGYVIEVEDEKTGKSEEFIRDELPHMLDVMKKSATDFLEAPSMISQRMTDGFAHEMHVYTNENEPIVKNFNAGAIAMTFSILETNAAMGKIVASPTTSSAEILPTVLMSFKQRYNCTHGELINAMLVVIDIRRSLGKYATSSGAGGGCQTEIGSAVAMAAGAMIFLRGGSTEQVFYGASSTILHVLGSVCDPIAGLVEYPCTFRNAIGATNTMISADMALIGITSTVPFGEVCQAIRKVGKTLSLLLRETGMGGVAGTKTRQGVRRGFLGSCSISGDYED